MASKNVCHGCLSVERQLVSVEAYEIKKLYNRLLLKKSIHNDISLVICWECHQILKNIQTFRLKITLAQKRLNDKRLSQRSSLSNLTISKKIDNYQLIIYEDEKLNQTQIKEIDIEASTFIKQEDNVQLHTELDIKGHVYDIKVNAIKEEVKNESDGFEDCDDRDHFDDKDGITELDEILVPIDLLEKKAKIKVERSRRKRGEASQKYRTIILDDIPDKRSFYDIVKIDQETATKWREDRKKKTSKKNFQCQLCYAGFAQQKFYDRHVARWHAQKNKFECDLCGCRYPTRGLLKTHINAHYVQYVCKMCGAQYPSRSTLYVHFAYGPHARRIECKQCKAIFDCNRSREFFAHYRNTHGAPTCDHCGQRCTTKSRLARHIQVRHSDYKCKLCNVGFSSFQTLTAHIKRKHTVDNSERNYCVECDMQFANSMLYNEHVKRSTKHRVKPRIPCPACDKTYSKRVYMTNHYNLEHLKESKFVCPACDRSFLNGFRLRYHMKYFHEKAPKPKNHICSYCGKGFNTRRILDNHVRTHTGERPFSCPHCSAAFAQTTALKTHMRSAHK